MTPFPPAHDGFLNMITDIIKGAAAGVQQIPEVVQQLVQTHPLAIQYVALFGLVALLSVSLFLKLAVPKTLRIPSKFQTGLLYDEVLVMNIALFVFGLGFVASVLLLIFYPHAVALVVVALYTVALFLRSAGKMGSYASTFFGRHKLILANRAVTVFDATTRTAVMKMMTSETGRLSITVPSGLYYMSIAPDQAAEVVEDLAVTAVFKSSGGLLRKRFIT